MLIFSVSELLMTWLNLWGFNVDIRIVACENEEKYYVENIIYCPEEGDLTEKLTLNANELGEYLLKQMPYKPKKSKKASIHRIK